MVSVADAVHVVAGGTLVVDRARLQEPDGVCRGEILKGASMNSGEPEHLPDMSPLEVISGYIL